MLNSSTASKLYSRDGHECLVFHGLVSGDGIQANQFLIIDQDHAALIDPGGDLTYTPLSIEVSKYIDVQNLDYVLASHQDPDIIASLPRWMLHTRCKVVTSKLWSRFLPHLASSFVSSRLAESVGERIIALPDGGGRVPFGRTELEVLPAHFLHSVGNFHFYDPVSKILFSGDMGASMVDDASQPVADFDRHLETMEGFHRRYMCSRRAASLWVNMVRGMDVEMIVPQHGRPFVGKEMINRFLDWVSDLSCGVDLLEQKHYRRPY